MSKIDELIREFCPDGVPYEKVGDIAVVGTGRSDKKDATPDGEYPFYVRSKIIARINTFEFDEESIVIPGEGGIGEIFHYVTGKYALHQRAYRIHFTDSKVIPKFAYYHFMAHFKVFIMKKAVSATVTSIRKPMITDFPVPIPPLEVQKEIVNILDKFTQLEAELSAELEARRKQYDYYRNHLLTYEESNSDIRWASIGDVTLSTKNIKWKEVGNASYEYIDLSSVSRDDHSIIETSTIDSSTAPSRAQKLVREGDIIFATTRPTLQRYTIINNHFDGQVASTGYCVLRPKKEVVTSQWIYHNIAKSDFNNYTEKNQEGSAYPAISDSKVKAFVIPVPPISEQQRIVSLLDKFEMLVNDISTGLPAEIKARRKQYEYYRTKLLTFQELAA